MLNYRAKKVSLIVMLQRQCTATIIYCKLNCQLHVWAQFVDEHATKRAQQLKLSNKNTSNSAQVQKIICFVKMFKLFSFKNAVGHGDSASAPQLPFKKSAYKFYFVVCMFLSNNLTIRSLIRKARMLHFLTIGPFLNTLYCIALCIHSSFIL